MAGLFVAASWQPLFASEFGNVFGNPDVEKASREASATALQAIGQVIEGIRVRELRDDGNQNFAAASQLFSQAAAQMEEIIGQLPSDDLTASQMTFLQSKFVAGSNVASQLQDIRSVASLYRLFAANTRRLSEVIVTAGLNQNAFSVISPVLIEYFQLADAVVAVQGIQ